ncbi:IclR family transcriptional regulator [Aquamicrobium defluvii]|uniref:IclR family transcriptional regulator n=1 Tax=Aquamicrobium defluvii TaxID=69279 RepID=A0A011U282_9HYPH|nr:IclR family transcriptional regulator [Aquamicrobium defluvii]EXL10547.1 IclR family transcriptional regulator [Aquamicrobium defluvii]EZQ17724.1 IclR family transcriptional regulator [Halopseudomonas bauzanensis]TDR27725.1 IclR family transcriptional regulator [Aquamicrobium defluvii]
MRKRRNPGEDGKEAVGSATSLTRGLEILRAFTPDDSRLGNQDLMERTQLPAATISRLTSVLVGLGYLHYDVVLGRYSIGPATVSLSYSALSSNPVIYLARPLMQELADWTGAAVALGTRDGLEMVYLANCRSMSPVTLQLNVGSRVPIARTAMGLAYIAEMDAAQREPLIAAMRDADAPSHGVRKRVDQAIRDYTSSGFVSAFGVWHSYINAVGVAFRPTDGSPVLAITCGGIADILPDEFCIEKVGPRLVQLVQRLRLSLAGEGPSG